MKRLRAVVFDWAGTTVDHGSVAPVTAFVRLFAAHDIPVTLAQARAPMGLDKMTHLRAMLAMREIAAAWHQQYGRDWNDQDVRILYDAFMPIQLAVIEEHAGLAPRVLETAAWLRQHGLRIGATTGYFRAAAELVAASAKLQGYEPDTKICVDDVPEGRPAPWMMLRNLEALRIYPPSTVVKVGDTVPDIGEGLSAGSWSVGVLRSSSEVGCTEAEWDALPAADREQRLSTIRTKLLAAGAHAVIETLAELPALLTVLDERMVQGEKP